MRLLVLDEHGQVSLTKELVNDIPPYAILSHTWGEDEEEITFRDFTNDCGKSKSATRGFRKIQFCGEQAARDGLKYFWVDTCCIDKTSSAELQEAINCMFRWYRDATRCYVYLEDVSIYGSQSINESVWEPAFRRSRWFTRGWTLQELIAPSLVDFFSSEGQLFGNKRSLEHLLHEITGINIKALRGHDLSVFSIDERLSWAADRQTKRKEDKAYSLLGIFDIFMSLRYGEGADLALRRLKEKIYKRASTIRLNVPGNVADLDQWEPNHGGSFGALSLRYKDHNENETRTFDISRPYLSRFGTSLVDGSGGMYGPWCITNDADNSTVDLYGQGRFSTTNPQHRVPLLLYDTRRRATGHAMEVINDWLDMTNFNRQYNAHQQFEKQLSLHLDRTCDWIFHKPEYSAWTSVDSENQASRVLWVCGPAGHGKSVLCARIVKYFKAEHECPVAHFFSSAHASSASASDMNFIIRSWMSQIASVDIDILELILGFSERSEIGNRASESEIWSAFEAVLAQKRGVTLFLDGYDEYPRTDDSRVVFLRKLKNAAAGTRTKILITSREESDIKAELSPPSVQTRDQVIFQCKIKRDDVDEDLRLYSRSVVDRGLPNKDENLREKLADQLARRCEGMFLWIKMQQLQQNRGKNKKQLEKIVEEMPRGLIDTYRKNWEIIERRSAEDQDRAFAILRWAIFASRPVTISEISEALVVNAHAKCKSLPLDELPDSIDNDYIEGEIIDICGALIESREPNTQDQPGSRTIHLVHPTVREFLLSILPKYQSVSPDATLTTEYAASPTHHHRYLATICLNYLNYDNIWSGSDISIGGRQFLSYAARFWHVHLEKAEVDDDLQLQMTNNFFRTGTATFQKWAKYFEFCQNTEDKKDEPAGTPMYYAALFNLHMTMASLWNNDKTQLNVLGGRYGTPLQAACAKHKKKAFDMLVKWGVDVNVEGGEFGTALVAAAAGGFRDMVSVLITNRANLELKDSVGRTALHTAAINGFRDVVDDLLTAGAEIATIAKNGHTLAQSAAAYGRLEVLQLLLDRGADVTSSNKYGRTPVYWAAFHGHLEVVRLLLDQETDAITSKNEHVTPVHLAAYSGPLEVLRLLLDRGADATSPTVRGITPIYIAARGGHLKVVQLLLDRGANIMTPTKNGWRPFHTAAEHGHLEVVQLLLDRGADAKTSNNNWAPVHLAAENGHSEVVQLLLDRGTDAMSQTVKGMTPIYIAARGGHLKVVQLLLDRGANTMTPTNNGWMPIHIAAENGHLEVVQSLLNLGANATSPTVKGATPVYVAAGNGHLEVVRLLLDRGADALASNMSGQTPFHCAALTGNIELLNLLVDRTVCPPTPSTIGGRDSPSQEPILRTNSTLQHVFDVNATCEEYGTVVHAAAYKGHLPMLRALVEVHRADITVRDHMGRTPLHLAIRGANILCMNYLLDLNQGLSFSDVDFAGHSTIYYACSSGSLEVTQRIMETDPVRIQDAGKWSLLHWACRTGDLKLIDLLVHNGCCETLVATTEPQAFWNPVSIAVFHGNSKFESTTAKSLSELFKASTSSSTTQHDSTSKSVMASKGVLHSGYWCNGCFHVSLVRN
jgi:ankyrin repeat protein